MSKKDKNIPIALSAKLENLNSKSKAILLELWLNSDYAGIATNNYGQELKPLFDLGLIHCSREKIVLKDYLSSNFGKLKEEYNPHAPVWKAIENAGFAYNAETHQIIIPEEDCITDFSSFTKLETINIGTNTMTNKSKPLDVQSSIIIN